MADRIPARLLRLALACTICAGPLAAQEPLSVNGWLSDVVTPRPQPAQATRAEPGVASSAAPDPIEMRPLDRPVPDGIGLGEAADHALPEGLWSASEASTLARQLEEMRPPSLPSMQKLLHGLLTVRAAPPRESALGQAFFLARLDALLALGRFEDASEMMRRAGYQEPEIFRRWFDVTILTGSETQACRRMRAMPEITPTYPARIFCLARSGDWPAAAVTLETARALAVITPAETERLTRFLDDHSEHGVLPPPPDPSPLDFLLYEAMGEPMRTSRLPLPFAHADLRPITGWMARIGAAERLARYAAIGADELWSVYLERAPAASGLPWDRVGAAQRLDRALDEGDAEAVTAVLPDAWQMMMDANLLPALAARVGGRAVALPLEGQAKEFSARLALLDGREVQGLPSPLSDLAAGTIPTPAPGAPLESAIAAGLANPMPSTIADLVEQGRVGEALLHAIRLVEAGAGGSLDALTDGLAILSGAGQRDVAFRAASELVVMGRMR